MAKYTKYVQPFMPSSGYSFVAAAALWRNYAGYCVYVKHKPGGRNIRLKRSGYKYQWFECPDRELVVVKNSFDSDAFYPWGDSFDECIDLSLYNDTVSQNFGLNYIMTNYAHSGGTKHIRLTATTPPEKRIQMMSDSGGLQLIVGVKDVIHPIDLITYYNNNVDAGMVLDVPLHFDDPKLAKKLALLQRDNTNIMLKYNDGIDLINIFHGQTSDERKRFKDIVEDSRIDRVAMARGGQMQPVTMVNAICEMLEGEQKYKQYHILGVYSATHVPLLVKLANLKSNPVHITSDSTSHIQSALNKAYHHQFDIFHYMKRVAIGTRGAIPSSYRKLPCQCKVCTTLKYTDLLGFMTNTFMELLAIHNAYEMSRCASQLQEVCVNEGHAALNALVKEQLKKHGSRREVESALDFIDIYDRDGLPAAQKKYRLELNKMRLAEPEVLPRGLYVDQHVDVQVNAQSPNEKRERAVKKLAMMTNQIKDRN
jgi:hypothetical protein